jgi:alkanesulfonate monooxygenase
MRRAGNYKELEGNIDFQKQLELCLLAEGNGIDSMLMAIGFTRPDPLLLAVALGQATQRIKFLIAVRSGLISPAYYVQQLNTASTLLGDRIHINVVNGHTPNEQKQYGDYLEHDARYARTHEFVQLCHRFWDNEGPVNFKGTYYHVENGSIATPFNTLRGRPEIYIGGNSKESIDLVCHHGDCIWRFPEIPEVLAPKIQVVLESGKEVGLLASIIARPTLYEAQNAANELLQSFANNTQSNQKENCTQKVRQIYN